MCTEKGFRQAGLTLVELIVFIVILGIGLAGIALVYNTVLRHSPSPVIHKQALSIAESLLLEIEQQPFTWCDPQDPAAPTANGYTACTNPQNALGPTPAGETRGGANPFDNVADYHGYTAPASDILGHNTQAGYEARVSITRVGGTGPFVGCPADAVLRIEVTVTGSKFGADPSAVSVTLTGYRTRYAPNAAG